MGFATINTVVALKEGTKITYSVNSESYKGFWAARDDDEFGVDLDEVRSYSFYAFPSLRFMTQ